MKIQNFNSTQVALPPISATVTPLGGTGALTDAHLFHLCKAYGERTRFWRRKFIGLLPEVNRRKLYEKKGFQSVYVFAYKLAGLSQEQVNLALNLEARFEKTPALKELLVSGEVSINKLARVVSIATPENQGFLAENVKNLSKGAVETLVRDEKFARTNETNKSTSRDRNGLRGPLFGLNGLPGQTEVKLIQSVLKTETLNLSHEVHQQLLGLQQKGLNINQLLLEFLQKRDQEITKKKEQIRKKILQKEDALREQDKDPSRHTPAAAEKILKEEFGTKCAVRGCKKTAVETHHTLPFSVGKTHDPYLLIPLCKGHHELAHSVNQKYREVKKSFAGRAS